MHSIFCAIYCTWHPRIVLYFCSFGADYALAGELLFLSTLRLQVITNCWNHVVVIWLWNTTVLFEKWNITGLVKKPSFILLFILFIFVLMQLIIRTVVFEQQAMKVFYLSDNKKTSAQHKGTRGCKIASRLQRLYTHANKRVKLPQ